MTFDQVITRVGIAEGKYSTDQHDRGNWSTGIVGQGLFLGTKYGISGMSYPNLNIKNLTWEQAKQIYLYDFWTKYRVPDVAPAIRLFYMDSLVNHGSQGVFLLQKAIGGVSVDGVIGRETIGQSHKATPWSFAEARSDYYVAISQNGKNDENDRVQLKGWLRRNLNILKESL